MDAEKKRRLIKILLIAAGVLAATVLVVGLSLIATARSFARSDQIAHGVTIAGVDVAGMSQTEAVETLHTQWVPRLPKEVSLKYGQESVSVPPEQLGARLQLEQAAATAYRIGREGGLGQQIAAQLRLRRHPMDVPVHCEVDTTVLRSALVELTEKINRKPRDATVEVKGDDVTVIPGEVGKNLDVDASQQALAELLGDPLLSEAELVVKIEEPAITKEMLANLNTVLARYSTPFNPGNRDRTHNLRLAVNILNKTIVKPGEEFSLNETVGPRLTEAGYRQADIFVNGEVVPSTGGGVCQVTSTLYNATLLANLRIVQRRPHSRPVDYVPSGRDATVYYGQIDFKFVNSLKHPILILGHIEGSRLHVRIIGSRDDKYEVELVRTNVSTIPFGTKETPDPELEDGKRVVETKGRNGVRVTLIRLVKKGGEQIAREVLHTDSYRPQAEEVRVGTKKPEEPDEPPDAPAEPPAPAQPAPATPASEATQP